MITQRSLKIKLFLLINLIYLSNAEISIWESEIKENNVEGSGIDADFIPSNSNDIMSRSDVLLSTMNLNGNQLKEINSLLSANNELLKNEIKLLIKSEMNNNKKDLDVFEVKCSDNRLPENCDEINECHNNIYSIMLPSYSDKPFPALCDMKTSNGGWTVIQRRQDGSENFFRNWTEYVEGFGNLNGEFFIGLEKLHALTTQGDPQELYIILEDFERVRKYANYKTFSVESASTDYKLNIGEYSGNAGDSLEDHNENKFSTRDQGTHWNCADEYKGGWWYHSCHNSNLNGMYLLGKTPKSKSGQGVSWGKFRGIDYSLKFVQMMIRRKQANDDD